MVFLGMICIFGTSALVLWYFKRRFSRLNLEKESIVESLDEGVIVLNGEQKITYANPKMAQMLEVRKQLLVGNTLETCSDKQALLKKCRDVVGLSMKTGKPCFDSVCYDTAKSLYCDLMAKPIASTKHWMLIVQDSSSFRKAKEIGKDFIANASHELRTPIAVIKGFTETLRELPEISEAMLEDILEKMYRNCTRMDQLVKNLLLLADLDYLPQTRMQECDLKGLIEACCYLLYHTHPSIQIETAVQENISVLADPYLLELALMNLLENGVKYANGDPYLKISVELKGDIVWLKIKDRGIGIPEKECPYIFDRFYTVDKARSRKLGGTGLGLSIVKAIIEKHGGTISVHSKVNRGTEFTIQLQRSQLTQQF